MDTCASAEARSGLAERLPRADARNHFQRVCDGYWEQHERPPEPKAISRLGSAFAFEPTCPAEMRSQERHRAQTLLPSCEASLHSLLKKERPSIRQLRSAARTTQYVTRLRLAAPVE